MSLTLANTTLFIAKLQGRDQANKVVQYGAKFLAYIYGQQGNKEAAAKMKALSALVSVGRNLFRFGASTNYVAKLLKFFETPVTPRSMVQFANDLFMTLYYMCDSTVFLCRAKLYTGGSQEQMSMRAFRMWTTGLIFAVTDKSMEVLTLWSALAKCASGEHSAENIAKHKQLQAKLSLTYTNIFKDLLNLLVAFDGSKLPVPVQLNEGFVCLCGLTAALMSVHSLWPEQAKAPAVSTSK